MSSYKFDLVYSACFLFLPNSLCFSRPLSIPNETVRKLARYWRAIIARAVIAGDSSDARNDTFCARTHDVKARMT